MPNVDLVGRTAELNGLRHLVADVANGRGRSVWIEGEPGIGKSALLSVVVGLAQEAGCQVFRSQAYEAGEVFPLRPMLDALRVDVRASDPDRKHIAGLLWGRGSTAAVTPNDAVAAAAESLVVLVERTCLRQPMILALDDAQVADEVSLAVWGRLHRMVHQLPLLLVAAARLLPARDALQSLRRSMVEPDAVVLQVPALSQTEGVELLRRLVGSMPGESLRRQVARAGGNPLYLRELADALTREGRLVTRDGIVDLIHPDDPAVPASVAAAVSARLGFLSQPATQALRLASLLSPDFGVDNLAVVANSTATELLDVVEEALTAGVLEASGMRLRFRHPLIRQVLYEAMPAAVRVALHEQAGAALASAGAGVEVVAEQVVAEQVLAAPRAADTWVVDWLAGAAPALIDRAPRVAVALLQRVRETMNASDPRRAEFDVNLAAALFLLGRYDEVERLGRPVLAATSDPELVGRLAWTLGYALRRQHRADDAIEVVTEALARPTLTRVWRARLQALEALSVNPSGRCDQAMAMATRAEAAGREADDRLAVAYALQTQALVTSRHHKNVTGGLQIIDRALAVLADSLDTAEIELLLLSTRAACLENLGRPADADRAFARCLAVAQRAGAPTRLAMLRVQGADFHFLRGRWADAVAELEAVSDIAPLGTDAVWRRGLLTLIAIHTDDRATANELLRGIEDLSFAGDQMNYYGQYLRIGHALAAERNGNPAHALTLLRQVFDPEATGDFPELYPGSHLWLPDLVRLALAGGDRVTADAATEVCRAAADHEPLPQTEAAVRHCESLTAGDPGPAMEAAEMLHGLHYPLYRSQALESAAVLYAQHGTTARARAAYADAERIYSDLDARWDLTRAHARLRPYGIRRGARGPRRRPSTGWEALTATELKIANLVAAGQSNSDIANEMFLSRRTVQTHVSHILTKLEAQSRIEIARRALVHQDT
jgi:DNA-binding CsgD family transcriptional regulator